VLVSDTIRYSEAFTPPGSLSRNHAPLLRSPPQPTGPPLLFTARTEGPVSLGDRKHVFIDDALLATIENLRFAVNPPTRREVTDFACDRPWEATPRFGSGVPDIGSIWDDGDHFTMIYTNGGMWGGKAHAICLATSNDGLEWQKPDLEAVCWEGSTRNNIVLRDAAQGMALKDPRSDVPQAERYKYVAWCMNRGFYVFTSPDAVHWRRNETVALPFDPDGSISLWWDDQRGRFAGLIRALDGPPESPDWFRGTARVEIPEIMAPWPFTPSPQPKWHAPFALPKPTSGELPRVEGLGQVYRHMAVKYAWAPDVYLAFPWRYAAKGNIRPGSFLLASRDGVHRKRYEAPYYFPSGWKLNGREVLEALMEQGLVRRGDVLYQFGTVRFTEHGGALYRGVEHEGPGFDRLLRLSQRLDGFVALETDKEGFAATRPLVFRGRRPPRPVGHVLEDHLESSLWIGVARIAHHDDRLVQFAGTYGKIDDVVLLRPHEFHQVQSGLFPRKPVGAGRVADAPAAARPLLVLAVVDSKVPHTKIVRGEADDATVVAGTLVERKQYRLARYRSRIGESR